MNPVTILAIIVGVVVIVALGVMFVIYCCTPAKRWRDVVWRLRADGLRRRQSEEAQCRDRHDQCARDLKTVGERHFRALLRRLETDELKAYPGIGDVIVERLRDAGFASLADLQHRLPDIPSIGEKRLADIRFAVRDLTRQANKMFDSGMCAEAEAVDRESRRLISERDTAIRACQNRIQSIDRYLGEMAPLIHRARRTTFVRFLLGFLDKQWVDDGPWPALPSRWCEQPPPLPHAPPMPIEPVSHATATAASADAPAARSIPVGKLVSVTSSRPKPWVQVTPVAAPEFETVPSISMAMTPSAKETPNRHLRFMELTLQFLFAAARADGHIARKEREIIEEQVQQRYGYDAALLNRARSFCAQFETEAIDLEECYRQIAAHFGERHRHLLMSLATQIAEASRGINAREEAFLVKASQRLGVPRPVSSGTAVAPPASAVPASAPSPSAAPPASALALDSPAFVTSKEPTSLPTNPRAVLEIDASAALSADLIRRQYNLLMGRFEADRMQAMGHEFAAMAAEKRRGVTDAAKELLNALGVEPDLTPPTPRVRGLRDNPDLDQIFGA